MGGITELVKLRADRSETAGPCRCRRPIRTRRRRPLAKSSGPRSRWWRGDRAARCAGFELDMSSHLDLADPAVAAVPVLALGPKRGSNTVGGGKVRVGRQPDGHTPSSAATGSQVRKEVRACKEGAGVCRLEHRCDEVFRTGLGRYDVWAPRGGLRVMIHILTHARSLHQTRGYSLFGCLTGPVRVSGRGRGITGIGWGRRAGTNEIPGVRRKPAGSPVRRRRARSV